jgi:hypothetical protein
VRCQFRIAAMLGCGESKHPQPISIHQRPVRFQQSIALIWLIWQAAAVALSHNSRSLEAEINELRDITPNMATGMAAALNAEATPSHIPLTPNQAIVSRVGTPNVATSGHAGTLHAAAAAAHHTVRQQEGACKQSLRTPRASPPLRLVH